MAQVKREQGCQFVLNGSLFDWNTLAPLCKFRVNGKTLADDTYGYWMYGWNVGNDIRMIHSDQMEQFKNGVACVALLKDGRATLLSYNKDQGGVRGRSAMGLDKDGNLILFCSKDGTSAAQTPEKLVSTMKSLGCVSAIMLDSGGSSSCDFNGQIVKSSRKVANYICIWTKPAPTTSTKCPYKEPTTTLKADSKGDGVKWVQWYLNAGGSKLAIDGTYGAGTQSAVKAFQRRVGVTADGIVGPATRRKLKEG